MRSPPPRKSPGAPRPTQLRSFDWREDRRRPLSRSFLVNVMVAALLLLVAVTLIALVSLWPDGSHNRTRGVFASAKTEGAEVVELVRIRCRAPQARDCERVGIELRSGPDKGGRAAFTVGETASDLRLSLGDRIRVTKTTLPSGAVLPGGRKPDRYQFYDFDRRSSMFWLAIGFALLVVLTSRLRGLRALIGLGLSLLIILEFVIPAILDGRSPVAVALVGSFAVMLVTLPLAHGFGAKMVAAALGTAVALLLTAGLASLFTNIAHLSGISSDEAIFIRATQTSISLQGLLLAGMVIGALGVLDDLTVSQASTVMALRRANRALTFRPLLREALSVGHDHIAATVNTLVLAYVGAALPVMLVFSIGNTPFGDAVNTEAVAENVVAMLVGSIGLIMAVPITTALAALLALRMPERKLPDVAHAHPH